MRVSYMEPGRRAREERLVSREFPDYKTDDRGEPSDASAEEVRTYAAHRFVVAACQFAALRVALYRLQGAVRLLQGPSSRASAAAMADRRLLCSTFKNRCDSKTNHLTVTYSGDCRGGALPRLLEC